MDRMRMTTPANPRDPWAVLAQAFDQAAPEQCPRLIGELERLKASLWLKMTSPTPKPWKRSASPRLGKAASTVVGLTIHQREPRWQMCTLEPSSTFPVISRPSIDPEALAYPTFEALLLGLSQASASAIFELTR
jgi:hypothetical protein